MTNASLDRDGPSVSAEDQEARLLLLLLREPQSVIQHIDEVWGIEEGQFTRKVKLTIDLDESEWSTDAHDSSFVIDLLRPQKGSLPDIQILSGGARRLTHNEHVELSKFLIRYRFLSVCESILFAKAPGADYYQKIVDAITDLERIPEAAPTEARAIYDANFVHLLNNPQAPMTLKALEGQAVYSSSSERMYGLQLLCDMLCECYLILVRTVGRKVDRVVLEYEYTHDVSELPASSPTTGSKRSAVIHRLAANYRGLFGVTPNWFRVHIPLAKRTNHYTLKVTPPEDYFISNKFILEAISQEEKHKVKSASAKIADDRVKWAFTMGRRRVSQFFIGNGPYLTKRLFLGLILKELPARSMFRAAAILILGTLVLVGFTVLTLGGSGKTIDTASTTVALLSLASLWMQAAMPRAGLLGAPILARSATLLASVVSIMFCFWLLSHDLERSKFPDWLQKFARFGHYWKDWAGIGLSAILLVGTLWVIWQCISITRAFLRVTNDQDKHNLYDELEG
jgi:hypothetical protein